MTVYNLDTVRRVGREVVSEAGADFVYELCPVMGYNYVHSVLDEEGLPGGELCPGCIVGRILIKLNPEVDLKSLDKRGTLREKSNAFAELGFVFTDAAAFYLNVLQGAQDNKAPWGIADQIAYELCARYRDMFSDSTVNGLLV